MIVGVPENQPYQEPSQFPKAGSTKVKGNNIPNVVGGKNLESSDAGFEAPKNKALKAPERRSGEAVSALIPSVEVYS